MLYTLIIVCASYCSGETQPIAVRDLSQDTCQQLAKAYREQRSKSLDGFRDRGNVFVACARQVD